MLGSGFVAEFYMLGLANVNGQEVVACYSRGSERTKEFARRWSIADSTDDLDGLVARSDIDLFVIALPNDAHLPVSLKLSKAGRNQVCTKPLARTGAEAKQMWEAAKASGVCSGCVRGNPTAGRIVRISGTSRRRAAGR